MSKSEDNITNFSQHLATLANARIEANAEARAAQVKMGLALAKKNLITKAKNGHRCIPLNSLLAEVRARYSVVQREDLEDYITNELVMEIHPGSSGEVFNHPHIKW